LNPSYPLKVLTRWVQNEAPNGDTGATDQGAIYIRGTEPAVRKKNLPLPSATISPNQAEDPLILTIDLGTTFIRTALFDRLGRAVEGAAARQAHNINLTAEGASEADPDLLLQRVFGCLDRLLAKSRRLPSKIAGVASCTFVNNILGIDKKNQAVTPLTTYADTRAQGEVAGLKADFDEAAIQDRTGCRFHSSYLPARLRWLFQSQPDLFRRVVRWISIGEYMELKLFGVTAVSYSVASWTGLLNRRQRMWDGKLLSELPVGKEQLSPLTDVSVPRRGLRPPFASRWPALRQLPWFPAVGDGATANIGSGCLTPARLALTVGTTSALRVVMNQPVGHIPSGLWNYCVDERRSLLGGALSEGGNVFAWMKTILNFKNGLRLEADLAALGPDAHALTLLPFLSGERSPGWAGEARATIHGLSLATNPLHILRAGLEAVAYRVALVFGLLRQKLPAEPEIVASGGALLHSPTWLQIMADVLGRPVAVSGIQEASSRGAALLALESLGTAPNLERIPDFISAVQQPIAQRHVLYLKAMERQQNLYQKLVKPRGTSQEKI
jgi:gluconokinase